VNFAAVSTLQRGNHEEMSPGGDAAYPFASLGSGGTARIDIPAASSDAFGLAAAMGARRPGTNRRKE